MKFVAKFRCSNGHEQQITYGDGVEAELELTRAGVQFVTETEHRDGG